MREMLYVHARDAVVQGGGCVQGLMAPRVWRVRWQCVCGGSDGTMRVEGLMALRAVRRGRRSTRTGSLQGMLCQRRRRHSHSCHHSGGRSHCRSATALMGHCWAGGRSARRIGGRPSGHRVGGNQGARCVGDFRGARRACGRVRIFRPHTQSAHQHAPQQAQRRAGDETMGPIRVGRALTHRMPVPYCVGPEGRASV